MGVRANCPGASLCRQTPLPEIMGALAKRHPGVQPEIVPIAVAFDVAFQHALRDALDRSGLVRNLRRDHPQQSIGTETSKRLADAQRPGGIGAVARSTYQYLFPLIQDGN